MAGKGIAAEGLRIDWSALMRFKRTFTDSVPQSNERWLAESGIGTFHGAARFTGPTTIAVGDQPLEARRIHVATGARPATLPIRGHEHLVDSTAFLELEPLPQRILFIGGGYISFEFAHVAARAGAQVTILHRGPRPLKQFDPDLVELLVKRTRELGVVLHLNAVVNSVEPAGGALRVQASTPQGPRALEVEQVVHGAGRVPELDGMRLEEGNVAYGPRGVAVNEYLQSTTNPAVYAAGDCADTPGLPLTPVAAHEGRIVAANLLDGNTTRASYPPMPSLVFTVPALASVGLGEAEAKAQGLKFSTRFEETGDWYSTRRLGESLSAYKVLVEEGTGRILGAHLLGPNAEEAINVFTLAIKAGLTARDIKDTIFGYPTFSSDLSYMV